MKLRDKEICLNCKTWNQYDISWMIKWGDCKRYPKSKWKQWDDSCGEFKLVKHRREIPLV